MALEIKGVLERKLQVQSGRTERGPWKKQEFILRTQEQYPRTVCMNVWGEDKVASLEQIPDGSVINVSINIESREFNGRWYTDVRAWRIDVENQSSASEQKSGAGIPEPVVSEPDIDDLPF